MLSAAAVFILSLFIPISYGFNFLSAGVLLFFTGLIAFFFKKYTLIIFFVLGTILGAVSFEHAKGPLSSLPEKGFTETSLRITDLPELRADGQYQVHSYSIKIINSNANRLYRGQQVRVRGYAGRSSFNGRSYADIYAKSIEVEKEGLFVFRWVAGLRDFINGKIMALHDPALRSLLYCMILGNTNFVDYETGQSFRMTGVTHLLAISGMNVAIIAAGFVMLFGLFMKRKHSYLAACAVVILYVAAAGFGASIMRAGVMFVIFSLLKQRGAESEFLEAVVLSAFLVLVYNPFYVLNAGFWLSYTAVIGIYFFTEPLRRPFQVLGKPVSEILAVTLAANLATMPILLYSFHGVSVISPLANLIIIPVFNLLTYLLFIDFILVITGIPFIGAPLEWLISLLWKFSQKTADLLSLLSFSYQTVPVFTAPMLIGLYALTGLIFFGIPYFQYQKRLNRLQKTIQSMNLQREKPDNSI